MIVMNNVLFSGLNYKSIEETKDELANVYKSITGNDLKQQITNDVNKARQFFLI